MRPETPAETTQAPPAAPVPAARQGESDREAHLEQAQRLERLAERHPEDAEQLLLRAAAHFELADDRTRASTLYDGLLAGAPEDPALIRALKAANLWEYGHEAEAQAIVSGVRATAPRTPAPWIVVAQALEAHDELEEAHATYEEAVALLLDGSTPPPYEARPLLIGRHRVRRLLGLEHDAWDAMADALNPATVPLDELHDPKRTWVLGSDSPEELRAEITRLHAELATYRAALSRPFPVAVLHWPEPELTELLASYPALATEYPSYEAHTRSIESALRDLAASGIPNLGIVRATVPSYEAFAAAESTDPTTPTLLPLYTTTLATRALATPWPPHPRAECWCASGTEYERCHGAG
ncbi:hypothetical protein ACQYWQ_20090 [Streptomyces sp. P6-2-1]|uniref:hypothetical protein n=1 Tax=unclassified Streptomyces TaxID=2593676 RepID=UPI003D363D98